MENNSDKRLEDLSEEELDFWIKNSSSKKLASYVVAYRALGLLKQISQKCMVALMDRRAANDTFDFETFIEAEVEIISEMLKNKLK